MDVQVMEHVEILSGVHIQRAIEHFVWVLGILLQDASKILELVIHAEQTQQS